VSLVQELLDKAEERGPDWIGRALEKATSIAKQNLPEGELLEATEQGIAGLEDIAPQLARLGHTGLVSVVTKFYTGDERGAELEYLSAGAKGETLKAMLDRSYQASAEAVSDRVQRDKDWRAVKDKLSELGQLVVRVLPYLIAAAA